MSSNERFTRFLRAGFATAALVLVAGLWLSTTSCGVIGELFRSDGPPPRPFNHEAHLVRGTECSDCHESATSEAAAGMPSPEFCMVCHEDLDKDPKRPPEGKVAWFLDEKGEPKWKVFARQSEEVVFSHKAHADAKVACSACHAGMEKNTGLVPSDPQRMASCTACHGAQAPEKNACATCHRTIRRDVPPANHALGWERLHGECSRDGVSAATANDCALCHQRSGCVACHQTQRPGDHTAFWRHRAHGIAADVDRGRCQVCHTTDGCARCHRETAPVSHVGGWSAPVNGHCRSCHLPQEPRTGCAVCHVATPGHALAPPKPAWHNPAMVCRSCHAGALMHPDSGDDCNACHR